MMPKQPWTREELSSLWKSLCDYPNAQLLLAELAKRPEGYPLQDLLERSFSTIQHLHSDLSVTNRFHKAYRHHPRLWRFNRQTRQFTMPFHVARLIHQFDPEGIPG